MSTLHFLGASIDDFTFQKNIRKDTEMRLEATVKFAVRYNGETKQFAGDATVTVQDAGHEGLFRLKFHHVGVFACEGFDHNDENVLVIQAPHFARAMIQEALRCWRAEPYSVTKWRTQIPNSP